jgi:hypothetical protein
MRDLSDPAIVDSMSSPQSQDPYTDPSGNTEAFQAFVRRGGTPDEPVVAKKSSSTGMLIGVLVAVIVVAIVVWLVVK